MTAACWWPATAATTLPGLLTAEGRGDLAEEWRGKVRTADSEMPWEGNGDPGYFASLLGGAPLEAPSDLWKRTLAALANSTLADLLSPPGRGQIADALRLTGADALVYLLPPGGGRPAIPVEQSSLLAFMFHWFLVRDGLGPRDALRQAQLWMLDPRRPVPGEMPPELASRARRGSLAEAASWAAITHQGW